MPEGTIIRLSHPPGLVLEELGAQTARATTPQGYVAWPFYGAIDGYTLEDEVVREWAGAGEETVRRYHASRRTEQPVSDVLVRQIGDWWIYSPVVIADDGRSVTRTPPFGVLELSGLSSRRRGGRS